MIDVKTFLLSVYLVFHLGLGLRVPLRFLQIQFPNVSLNYRSKPFVVQPAPIVAVSGPLRGWKETITAQSCNARVPVQ